ncbi:MAG: GSCFA domain-containing protein [Bacteroidaceae bacterium]|nr:GSCFA domain-containing protein [Bacteroidaceae bacterium]
MKAEKTAFRTAPEVPKWTKQMQREHRFVLLGSCFAQYMGERFQSEGMEAVCNPLGAAYNPESIRIQVKESLSIALSKGEDTLPLFSLPLEGKGEAVWRCWWANTLLSDTDEGRFRETIHSTFSLLGNAILKADWLFLTLGTSVCYRLKENGMIVTNCHKVPDKNFEEVWLDTEACTETLCSMMELLARECPKLHVVFTVSPYRYKKYGLHGNQLAKATLLLAVDEVCKRFPENAAYFPAYEIMLDELRDYSFYADDMIHPAPAAVEHIWNRLWNG